MEEQKAESGNGEAEIGEQKSESGNRRAKIGERKSEIGEREKNEENLDYL